MDKVEPGRFYILGNDKHRYWSIPLYRVTLSNELVALSWDEDKYRWKEFVWGPGQITFSVEIEKLENTIPFNTMKDNDRRKTIMAILRR